MEETGKFLLMYDQAKEKQRLTAGYFSVVPLPLSNPVRFCKQAKTS